jgi:hypothetical protein
MRAATDTELWYKFVSQRLDNATEEDKEDWVGVVTPWRKPAASIGLCADDLIKVQDAIDGKNFAANATAGDWAGYAIGKVLNIDTATPEGKKRVKELMDMWTKTDVLRKSRGRPI